ncbi:MAG: 2Fe-2S iron-sulfur cluster-binding protein, partial [Dehalococcoidales bacterium]|nr:2Fe-2S iron-sulfur cluster-binding protein [Dehalococcoidales bacterium]
MDKVTVRFSPEGRTVAVAPNTCLMAAAQEAEAFVDSPCGGRGVCGKCRVQVKGSLSEITAAERKALTADELAEGWRLACQANVLSDVEVHVPYGTLQTVLSGVQEAGRLRPNVRKVFVRLPEPSLEDQRPDVSRLRAALAAQGEDLTFRPPVARDLGRVLREADFAVTAVAVGDECIAVEAGDTRDALYGVAFDIGTTTVVGALMDLNSGAQVAVASALNGQAAYGADVVS